MAGNDNPPDESGLPPRLSADGQAHIDHFALERGGIVRLDTMRLRQTGEHPALPLGVEVETLAQLREALEGGCDRVLIDDFTRDQRREAVRMARGAPFDGRIPLEVSGSVDLDGLQAIAADGVDFVSVGALTKHLRAIDLSMKLGTPPDA